jgi:hypothetical protein
MKHHLICLTLDTDPDGLSGKETNRRALAWQGLTEAQQLPQDLRELSSSLGCPIPLTWFVRADGQLRDLLGTSLYLLEKFEAFWKGVHDLGHEIGWHPHLYAHSRSCVEPVLVTDPSEACAELERLWDDLLSSSFAPTAFRNGEGWHCAQTLRTVEKFSLICDSTAIPGRSGGNDHPMNWLGTPNQPYFPDSRDIRISGAERPLLEMPMNTWLVQAPYETEPRIRYMNPAIHESLFADALDRWEATLNDRDAGLYVWVLIFHPDEIMSVGRKDLLYAHSRAALCRNIMKFAARVRQAGHTLDFATLSDAARRWRSHGTLDS